MNLSDWPFPDDDVADVRGVDRLDAALAERFVDRARNQAVRHVVQDLIAEALLDDLGGNLPRPEAGNAGGLAVVARDLVDFGIDDVAVDLDDEVFLGFGDVYEINLHCSIEETACLYVRSWGDFDSRALAQHSHAIHGARPRI